MSDRVSILGPLTLRTSGTLLAAAARRREPPCGYTRARRHDAYPRLAAHDLIAFCAPDHDARVLCVRRARVPRPASPTAGGVVGLAFGVVFMLNLLAAIPGRPKSPELVPAWGPLGSLASAVMVLLTMTLLLELSRDRVQASTAPG